METHGGQSAEYNSRIEAVLSQHDDACIERAGKDARTKQKIEASNARFVGGELLDAGYTPCTCKVSVPLIREASEPADQA